jgi:hypothetical protein
MIGPSEQFLQRRASDMRIGTSRKQKAPILDRTLACFLPAHDAPDYLPVLTNWMQSPWFLKVCGKLNLCHPPFLH